MMPTIAALAGVSLDASKPLDGMDVWQALGAGQASPRQNMVYNIEPTVGAVREGSWKLVWHATLPPRLELFDLSADQSETTDLSADQPEKVAELQGRVVELARSMAPPLFYATALGATLSMPLSTPSDALNPTGAENN